LNDVANAFDISVSELFAGVIDAEHKSFTAPQVAFDRQAFRIAKAFVKISDNEIRKLLIRLIETIAQKSGEKSNTRKTWASIRFEGSRPVLALGKAACRCVASTGRLRQQQSVVVWIDNADDQDAARVAFESAILEPAAVHQRNERSIKP
jgi:hypothetical protein